MTLERLQREREGLGPSELRRRFCEVCLGSHTIQPIETIPARAIAKGASVCISKVSADPGPQSVRPTAEPDGYFPVEE
jgi:hypothetical protein